MGFWAALEEVYGETRQQLHKTMNVLNCLPKSVQAKAKQALHAVWQAETKADAEKAFDLFLKTYEPKYPKATLCLHKDREELMAFYDFPAQHWQSIRTSNPIESTFATIRHRTKRSKGCLTRDGMLHMMFKLGQCAQENWRRLRGFAYLAKVDHWSEIQRRNRVNKRQSGRRLIQCLNTRFDISSGATDQRVGAGARLSRYAVAEAQPVPRRWSSRAHQQPG